MYENWKIKKSDLNNDDLQEKLQDEQSKVADWCNQNQQYRISDDEEQIFVEPIPGLTAEEKAEIEIARLKQYLADTDYVALKIAEGAATQQEYANVIAERAKARVRIKQLGG